MKKGQRYGNASSRFITCLCPCAFVSFTSGSGQTAIIRFEVALDTSITNSTPTNSDECLFGWDETTGIVSVCASASGRALVWRRVGGQLICEPELY